ncbi:hypothetical protein GW17_00041132 [Ensete ventricosum]|nr:hypothetical protein GW17_00041132 [Ensete ventricosum]
MRHTDLSHWSHRTIARVRRDLAPIANISRPHGTSRSTQRVVGGPLGSFKVEVISSSSGIMIPMDARAFKALMVMRSCHNYDLIMTVQCLVEVQERYSIPREYELHIPLLGERPYNDYQDGFGLSIDAL